MPSRLVALILALCLALVGRSAAAADPDALWRVVHDLCVPDMKASGLPSPCAKVDLAGGYVILKDLRGVTQLLLIPTTRRTGIESPELLAPDAANYWAAAWDARPLFEKWARRPVPRDDLGLAVNSIHGRTQNQLHIHIDCVRPEVREALKKARDQIGPDWTPLAIDLAGRRYEAMRLKGAGLGSRNPFRLLADGDPRARAAMGAETLAVIGETFSDGTPGFILLADRADRATGDPAAAEDLLDHTCAVLGG